MTQSGNAPITSSRIPWDSSPSEELVAILRQRVATKYYDQPAVIDALARSLLAKGGQ